MRLLIAFFLISWKLLGLSQNSTPVEITVNPNYRILTDMIGDSVSNGRYVAIYKNRTVLQGRTENGKMEGEWTSFYANGREKLKGKYVNGHPHGEWILWNEEGNVQAKLYFQNGEKTGHWEGFFSNGTKSIDFVFARQGNPVQCIQYFPSGLVSSNTEYHYREANVDSEHSYYFENRSLYHYEQRRHSIRHGDLMRFHSNGVVQAHYRYENGLLWTVKETRSELGAPLQNDSLWNGSGPLYSYYPNGNTRSVSHYQNGKQNGLFETYDYGKNLLLKGQYRDGNRVGKWYHYSKFHNLRMVKDYDTLHPLVYVVESTSPAPKERTEGTTLHGKKHGNWKSFDAYGELLSDLNFSYGFADGVQKFYESNKLTSTIQTVNGNKDGESTIYNIFGKVWKKETFQSSDYLDSNWYQSPIPRWVPVDNPENSSNRVYTYFYPYWPGMELNSKFVPYALETKSPVAPPWSTEYSFIPQLVQPSFPEGYLAEKDYISAYIFKQNVQLNIPVNGTVLVRYRVDEFGLISEIKVLKTIHPQLDEMAVDIIKSFPPLNSATYCGIPIPSYVVREIDFQF